MYVCVCFSKHLYMYMYMYMCMCFSKHLYMYMYMCMYIVHSVSMKSSIINWITMH